MAREEDSQRSPVGIRREHGQGPAARIRREHGQATIEYSALLGLVAMLLVVGAVMVGASGVGEEIVVALRRALCTLGAGTCPSGGPRPCVLARSARTDNAAVTVGLIRLHADAAVVRERRSDGTIAITLLEGGGGGAHLAIGAAADLAGVGRLGNELHGSVGGRLGHARTWVVRGDAAAGRVVEQLRDGPSPLVGAAREHARDAARTLGHRPARRGGPARPERTSWSYENVGEAAGTGPLGSTGRLALAAGEGLTIEHATGRRTIRVGMERRLTGELGALGLGGTAEGVHVDGVALTLDRTGEPVELRAGLAVGADGRGKLPGPAAEQLSALGLSPDDLAAGGRFEVDARLDLTEAGNRAAADRLFQALRRPWEAERLVGAARGLGDRLGSHAELDARAYTSSSTRQGGGAGGAAGLGLSAEARRRDEQAELVGAWSRAPGGSWAERLDCVS